VTTGTTPSTLIAFAYPSDPIVPGKGMVNTASLPLASLIVPPFNNNA
jgi:hypothetical protein